MEDVNSIFPNDTYLNGLAAADTSAVDGIYNEFRSAVVKAVEKAGGTFADGGTFFRVALIHTADLAHSNAYPEGVPVPKFLEDLAVAHYQNWLQDKGQWTEAQAETEIEAEAPEVSLPEKEAMREMRRRVRAKRQFARLAPDDQRAVLALAQRSAYANPDEASPASYEGKESAERYKQLFTEYRQYWSEPLPTWAVWALTDEHFHKVWSACEAAEKRISSSQVPDNKENKTIRNAFILFVLLTIGYGAYTWIFRDRSPAAVYKSNYEPPASIMEDMEKRYAKDSTPVVRPEACTIAFQNADAHYKKHEWRETADALVEMMDDSLASCQSDALFYLAIVGLELDRPELTLECIAKIDDLDRFGEDIYWYMALAYVKIAANDPTEKDTARRAVERARSNTEIPERREQAEKMLEDLAE